MIALMIGLTARVLDPSSPLPTPPIVIHPLPPVSSTVTTSYQCEDGPGTITIAYMAHTFSEVRSGERRGVPLTRRSIERTTAVLKRLEAVTTIIPECGERNDVLMVLGRAAGRPVLVYLRWSGDTIEASEPEPISL